MQAEKQKIEEKVKNKIITLYQKLYEQKQANKKSINDKITKTAIISLNRLNKSTIINSLISRKSY